MNTAPPRSVVFFFSLSLSYSLSRWVRVRAPSDIIVSRPPDEKIITAMEGFCKGGWEDREGGESFLSVFSELVEVKKQTSESHISHTRLDKRKEKKRKKKKPPPHHRRGPVRGYKKVSWHLQTRLYRVE